MIAIWNNPEWVRHRRAILRPASAVAIIAVSWLLCVVIAYVADMKTMIGLVILAHMIGLPLWMGLTCSKSLMHERAFQTFDFWRTTRLTPRELIAGQLCGVPLMGILAAVSTVPVALLAVGIGVSPLDLTLEYLMLLLLCTTIGLGSLTISMCTTPFRGSRGMTWLFGLAMAFFAVPFAIGAGVGNGLWVMTPYAFLDMLGDGPGTVRFSVSQSTPLFGVIPVPSLLLGVALNLSFSGWFALMLSRNIKKEPDEVRLLSRWQAVGFAIFITLLFHALGRSSHPQQLPAAATMEQSLYLLHILTLYLIGIIMLTPAERLRLWSRHWSSGKASYLHEDGFPWPWVVITTICLAGVGYLSINVGEWSSPALLWNLGLAGVFVLRDVTFLQWSLCQNFKRPLFTGLLYLGLYYVVALILTGKFPGIHSLLVPPMGLDGDASQPFVTVMIQGLIAGGLLHLLSKQLKQPACSVSPSSRETPQPPIPTASSPPPQ